MAWKLFFYLFRFIGGAVKALDHAHHILGRIPIGGWIGIDHSDLTITMPTPSTKNCQCWRPRCSNMSSVIGHTVLLIRSQGSNMSESM